MNEEFKKRFYENALTELATIGKVKTSCILRENIEIYKVTIIKDNIEYSCENKDSVEAVIQLRNNVFG